MGLTHVNCDSIYGTSIRCTYFEYVGDTFSCSSADQFSIQIQLLIMYCILCYLHASLHLHKKCRMHENRHLQFNVNTHFQQMRLFKCSLLSNDKRICNITVCCQNVEDMVPLMESCLIIGH